MSSPPTPPDKNPPNKPASPNTRYEAPFDFKIPPRRKFQLLIYLGVVGIISLIMLILAVILSQGKFTGL